MNRRKETSPVQVDEREADPGGNRTPSTRWTWVCLIGITAVYSISIGGPFIQDDTLLVAENPHVTSTEFPLSAWSTPVRATLPGGVEQAFYRPLSFTTLWLDARGGLAPWRFHLTQVLLHITAVGLLAALLRSNGVQPLYAGLAAGAWGVLPVHAETVSYISARHDVLFLPLFLVTLHLGWKARPWAWPRECGVLALGTLAFLAKEMAISLPLILVTGRILFRSRGTRLYRSTFLAPALMLAIMVAIRLWVGAELPTQEPAANYDRLTMVASTAWHNWLLIVNPLSYSLDHSADFTNDSSTAIAGAITLLLATALGVVLVRRSPNRRALVWGLATVFSYGPISGLVPIYSKVADRYLYLPLLFAVGFLTISLRKPLSLGKRRSLRHATPAIGTDTKPEKNRTRTGASSWAPALGAALLVALGLMTSLRTLLFLSPERVYAESLDTAPSSPLIHNSYGNWWLQQGEIERAYHHYKCAAKWNFPPAVYNVAHVQLETDQLDASQETISQYLELAPTDPDGWRILARLFAERGQRAVALEAERKAERLEAARHGPTKHGAAENGAAKPKTE